MGIKVKPNGKIIAVGSSDLAGNIFVVQLLSDGTLDPNFNAGGALPGAMQLPLGGSNEAGNGVAVLSDNSVLIAGVSDATGVPRAQVVSLLDNGNLKAAFGTAGIASLNFGETDDHLNAISVQTNGAIVVSGGSHGASMRAAIARLHSDGSIDAGFGGGFQIYTLGGIANDLSAVAVNGTDVYACGASRFAMNTFHSSILKVSANGALDTTFNTTGFLVESISTTIDKCSSIQIEGGSHILTIGQAVVNPALYVRNSFFQRFENLFFSLSNLIIPGAKAFTVINPTDAYVISHLQDGSLYNPFGAVAFPGIFVRDLSGGLGGNVGNASVFNSSGKLYVTGSSFNANGDQDVSTILLK